MIGIIGAMKIEVEDLLGVMEKEGTETVSGISFHRGRIGGTECVAAQCGVGKVAAAVCAQTMILRYRPEAVLNVGVAGGLGASVHIGDIVVSSGLVQHDMDTTAVGDEKGMISGIGLVVIPASKALSGAAEEEARGLFGPGHVHSGIIATGDQFIRDGAELARIADEFGACACDMEGGSIAQVCRLNRTGFTVIRAISDKADEKAALDYAAFAERSAKQYTRLMTALLPKIANMGGNPE